MNASVLNSLTSSRKLALRLMFAQALAATVVALACWPLGWRHATAALTGGLLVLAGTALMAARGLTRGPSGLVLARLLLGVLLRWIVVLCGVYVVLAGLQWPPAPLLAGLVAALLAPLFLRVSRVH